MQVHLQSISYKEEIFILQCPDALFPVINLNHFRLKSKVSRYICVDFPHLVFAQDLAWSWATSKRVRLSVIQIKYNTSDRRTAMLNQIQTLHFIFPLHVQKWFQSVCAQISALVLTTSLLLVGEVSGLTEQSTVWVADDDMSLSQDILHLPLANITSQQEWSNSVIHVWKCFNPFINTCYKNAITHPMEMRNNSPIQQ